MKLNEVAASQSSKILNESWETLTETQQLYMFKAERELWPLMEQLVKVFEAELTPDQIQQIFADAEKVAMASGDNKSALGKAGSAVAGAAKLPVDVMKAVNNKINELGRMAQKAGPIANADAKVEQLKKNITQSNPKLASKIEAVSDWVKANPKKASLGVAILTAAAAFAAGPAGGAAVGFLLRSTNEMLKGEKLSTAVGKAAKTAAVGALAGMALDNISGDVIDNLTTAGDEEVEAMIDSMKSANLEKAMADIDPTLQALFPELENAATVNMSGNINGFYYDYDVILNDEMLKQFDQFQTELDNTKTFSDEYYQKAMQFHDWMAGIQNDPLQGPYRAALKALETAQSAGDRLNISVDQWDEILDKEREIADKIKAISTTDKTIASAVQAGLQQADTLKDKAVKVSRPKQGELDLDNPNESLTMAQKMELYLAEADPRQGELDLDNPNTLGAKLKRGVKGAASKAASAVKGAASSAAGAVKQGAKDLGNKVTANKLMKAWKASGSPTDTGSIANILADAGMSNDQITSINPELKQTAAPASQSTAQQQKPAAQQQKPAAQPQSNRPAATPNNRKVDPKLQSLAKQIKQSGVADQIKQTLGNATKADPRIQKLANQIINSGAAEQVKQYLQNN